MPIWVAFLLVTVIWGSTPLAVQWSQGGGGYLFAVTARIAIGAVLFLFLIPWLRRRPVGFRQLVIVSLIAGLNLFASMFCVYWGARFIPSGWISVLFGLGPVLTGVMAALWLREPFTSEKILGSLIGLGGLITIFGQGGALGEQTLVGIGALLLAVLIYSAGNIGIKRFGEGVSPLWVTAGSLWVALPLYALSLWLSGVSWPREIPIRAELAIFYLGLVANGVGFVCFYYLLSRVSAANAVLVTLSAPVLALWIGFAFNQESLRGGVVLGTSLILGGLSMFQWGSILLKRRVVAPATR
ncbi:MAG: DMT family transporter [Magnetococcales bacterium]|nr:DMT family transporter [Magnetococcales bacterium]MBF0321661.1 DMT family transporter [Magnetococcales bacterium]